VLFNEICILIKSVLKCRGVFYFNKKNICLSSYTVKDGVAIIGNLYDDRECNRNRDCISNNYRLFGNYYNKIYRAEISSNLMKYGVSNGEACWKANECFFLRNVY